MKWIFWLNIVSPHLSPLIRELATLPDQSVSVVAEDEPAEERRAMGWRLPECDPAEIVVRPNVAEVERFIGLDSRQQTVHVFGGLQMGTLNRRVFSHLAKTNEMTGLLSENANKGRLHSIRRVKYGLDRFFLERKLDFILAMGQLGVQWFESAGYDSSRIFPFGYVTERPTITSECGSKLNESRTFRLLFLGRSIRFKDVVTAINALARLSDCDWQFDVIGDGPDLARWKMVAAKSGVNSRIRFSQTVDNRMVGNLLQNADLLILPSQWDGWGAVVNEALMCGLPVVCSDNCGSSDLLREGWRGSVFKTGSVESLKIVLKKWIESGRQTKESRSKIREWSTAIEGKNMARYLVEIVNYLKDGGSRPSPPWY